jgi:hypothetical protein
MLAVTASLHTCENNLSRFSLSVGDCCQPGSSVTWNCLPPPGCEHLLFFNSPAHFEFYPDEVSRTPTGLMDFLKSKHPEFCDVTELQEKGIKQEGCSVEHALLGHFWAHMIAQATGQVVPKSMFGPRGKGQVSTASTGTMHEWFSCISLRRWLGCFRCMLCRRKAKTVLLGKK